MKYKQYKIVLTNGTINNTYRQTATCEQYAVILAQAEAIQLARGIKLVSVVEV